MSISKELTNHRFKILSKKGFSLVIIVMLLVINFTFLEPFHSDTNITGIATADAEQFIGPARGSRSWGLTLNATPKTSGEYNAIAIGDFNGDKHLDMAFSGENYGGSTTGLYAYTGNGLGTWTSASAGLPTYDSWGGIALGDADADGRIELYAGNEGWGSNSGLVRGVGAWEYTGTSWSHIGITSPYNATGAFVNDIELLNFTKGPGLDIALTASTGSTSGYRGIKVYYGSGTSTISWTAFSTGLPTTGEYAGVDICDFNNDSYPDLAAVSYGGSGVHIFIQNSTANSWTDYTSTLPSGAKSGNMLGVEMGDINNDGHIDIIYGTRDSGMGILLGNSGGTSKTSFTWTTPTSTNGGLPTSGTSGRFPQIQLADIDQDGDLDLLAPKATSGGGLRLYLGNGSSYPGNAFGFTEVTTTKGLPTSGAYYGSIYLDYDNDTDLDVAGATWGNGIRIYENNL